MRLRVINNQKLNLFLTLFLLVFVDFFLASEEVHEKLHELFKLINIQRLLYYITSLHIKVESISWKLPPLISNDFTDSLSLSIKINLFAFWCYWLLFKIVLFSHCYISNKKYSIPLCAQEPKKLVYLEFWLFLLILKLERILFNSKLSSMVVFYCKKVAPCREREMFRKVGLPRSRYSSRIWFNCTRVLSHFFWDLLWIDVTIKTVVTHFYSTKNIQ